MKDKIKFIVESMMDNRSKTQKLDKLFKKEMMNTLNKVQDNLSRTSPDYGRVINTIVSVKAELNSK